MKNIKLFESFNEEPGQEIAPNQAEYPMLSISFGLDQTDETRKII